jgi:eukaryotic-like serine/threonine-protein kinase
MPGDGRSKGHLGASPALASTLENACPRNLSRDREAGLAEGARVPLQGAESRGLNDMAAEQPPAEVWREALASFERLIDLAPEDREQVLSGLARERPDLYPHVLTLLGADRAAEQRDFLAGGPVADGGIASEVPETALEVGSRFGSYQLERQVGMGGMGEVWLARRIDGRFEGTVALKVLHAHVAQSAARERFVREGRILGQLSHPHIARLLDAGATSLGVLYFVLEYIEGKPIDQWCDDQNLDVPTRLSLFLQVCEAVSHAHAHLVIHRDLKPPNILVSAQGEIKLLDFGIAKLVKSEKPAEETDLTRLSGRALTPDFAAPEQILGQPVTTATDVYALGILLYLLLSGRRPYQRQHMTGRELEHAAQTAEAAPLGRATSAGEDANAIAARRGSTLKKLKRALTGDLNTIVAKALQAEPERRYATVEQLSADVGRYLAGHPVLAVPDTWAYRTRKFVTRHLVGVSVGAAAVLLLAGFTVAMYAQMQRTARERERAEQVSSFMVDVFDLSDPYKGRGNEVTARQLLDASRRQVESRFAAQPETRAALLGAMGRVYNRLGLGADAQALLERALAGLIEIHGASDPEIAAVLNELGNALVSEGKFEPAEVRLQDALKMRRALLGAESPEVAETLRDLGNAVQARGDNKLAERYFRDSLTLYSRLGLEATPSATQGMNDLATLLNFVGRYDDAARLLKTALEIDRHALGEDDARVIMETHNLAYALQAQGEFATAEPLFSKSMEQMRRVFGPEHPYTIDALSNYGRFLRHKGDLSAAEEALREVLLLNRRVRGPEHLMVGTSEINLAIVLHDQGRLDKAEEQFRAGLATFASSLPPDHPMQAGALSGMGRVLIDRGRASEAIPLLRRAMKIVEATEPLESPRLAVARSSLGSALVAIHEYDEAEPLLRDSYAIVARTQGASSAAVRQARKAQADLERARRDQSGPP